MKNIAFFFSLFRNSFLIIAAFLFTASTYGQQAGEPDMTFNTVDQGFGHGAAGGAVTSIIVLPNQQVFIAGSFQNYNLVSRVGVALLNSDGTLDPTFNQWAGPNNFVITALREPSGKIIVAGDFSTYNGIPRNKIARINTDGSLDLSFDPGLGVNNFIHSMALQPDGKIVLGGIFTSYNGTPRNGIARIHTDGTLDSGFDPGTGISGLVKAVALKTDGDILAAGYFLSYNGLACNSIARINSDGTLDAGFDPGYGTNSEINALAILPNDKILIGGSFTLYDSIPRYGIARLHSAGDLDATFNTGIGYNNIIHSVAIQPDGKYIISGNQLGYYVAGYSNTVFRLNLNGTHDATFNIGEGLDGEVNATAVQPDGKVFIGGSFNRYNKEWRNCITRLLANGTDDPAFDSSTGGNFHIQAVAILQNQKMLVAGEFLRFNGEARNQIARLNSDGSLDQSFTPGVGPTNQFGSSSNIFKIIVQPDSQIIITGNFSHYNNIARNTIARLNTSGTLDMSFNPDPGLQGTRTAALQQDGKIVVGGDFLTFSAPQYSGIARLNPDGSLDQSFQTGLGLTGAVNSIIIQPDQKILIAGNFVMYNDTSRNMIARLNPDGSIDTSFDPGLGANYEIFSATLQPDGKIIIGGWFTYYNGTVCNRITRLNSDGSLDTSFTPAPSNSGVVYTTNLQPDGKILFGGNFVNYNGTNRGHLVRLNPDGSYDTAFNQGEGPNDIVDEIAFQQDGKIVVVGWFLRFNGSGRNRVARIFSSSSSTQLATSPLSQTGLCTGTSVAVPFTATGAFNSNNIFTAQLSNSNGSFASPVNIGTYAATSSGQVTAVIPASIPAGAGYRIRVISSSPASVGVDNGSNLSVNGVSVTATANNTTICLGASLNLSSLGATSYSWYGPGVFSGSSGSFTSVTPGAGGVHTYTVIGTSNTCSDTAVVMVNVNQVPNVTLSAANQSICSGQSVALTAAGATIYSWSNGQNGPVINVSPTSSANVAVIGTEAGCSSSDTVTIVVNATPNITTTATPALICAGQTSKISGLGADTYSWSDGQTGVFVFVSPLVTTTYTVTGVTAQGCTATTSVTVLVNPTPAVSVSDLSVCEGANVTFSCTATGGAGYSWSGPNSYSSQLLEPTLNNVVASMAGAYILTANLNGCLKSDTALLTVKPAPVASFFYQLHPCGCEVDIIDTSVGGVDYIYNFGDNSPVSTDPNPVYQYTASGNYTITQTVTNAVGCSSASAQTVSILLASANLLHSNLSIYPNPTQGILMVDLGEIASINPILAEVLTPLGQLVVSKQITQDGVLNLGTIADGFYLLRLTVEGKTVVKQVILRR